MNFTKKRIWEYLKYDTWVFGQHKLCNYSMITGNSVLMPLWAYAA